jgi:YD repeat-containing protein
MKIIITESQNESLQNKLIELNKLKGIEFAMKAVNGLDSLKKIMGDRLFEILDPPYMKNMVNLKIPLQDRKTIIDSIFGGDVEIEGRTNIYNQNGKKVYWESPGGGGWGLFKYDQNGNQTSYEDSSGNWEKFEYDQNGNQTSYLDNRGKWEKSEYDQNGKRIYRHDSDGKWEKSEYDQNGNKTYYENSKNIWFKREYDDRGKLIYYNDHKGLLVDKKPDNELENLTEFDPSDIAKKLNLPYFINLKKFNIPVKYWGKILSQIFKIKVKRQGQNIKTEDGRILYKEWPNGEWVKLNWDESGRATRSRSSDITRNSWSWY